MTPLHFTVAEIHEARRLWLVAELERTGLKREALAKAAGVSRGYISTLAGNGQRLNDRNWRKLLSGFKHLED